MATGSPLREGPRSAWSGSFPFDGLADSDAFPRAECDGVGIVHDPGRQPLPSAVDVTADGLRIPVGVRGAQGGGIELGVSDLRRRYGLGVKAPINEDQPRRSPGPGPCPAR